MYFIRESIQAFSEYYESCIMSDTYVEDSLTELNTVLNKSMALMENVTDTPQQSKRRKSVKIDTKIQPLDTPPAQHVSRKSILKNSGLKNSSDLDNDESNSIGEEDSCEIIENRTLPELDTIPRPHNLEDFANGMTLIKDPKKFTFDLDDISDNEELWIIDIPKTIDPSHLKGQSLTFGDKSKIKIGDERFSVVNRNIKDSLTCVFNSSKQKGRYKTVNIKPAGSLTVQRKLSSITKIKAEHTERTGVPFPKNLKVRHPLFGAVYKDKIGRKMQYGF